MTSINNMKITIYKSRKLQVAEYEPYEFGYGLEEEHNFDELGVQETLKEIESKKKFLENIVDEWIESETKKWEQYKKFTGQVATPAKEREEYNQLKNEKGEVIPF